MGEREASAGKDRPGGAKLSLSKDFWGVNRGCQKRPVRLTSEGLDDLGSCHEFVWSPFPGDQLLTLLGHFSLNSRIC